MRFIGTSIFYLQNMNATGFRACLKELYETRYDPVSVSYVVLAGELARNVAFLMQQNLMSYLEAVSRTRN